MPPPNQMVNWILQETSLVINNSKLLNKIYPKCTLRTLREKATAMHGDPMGMQNSATDNDPRFL